MAERDIKYLKKISVVALLLRLNPFLIYIAFVFKSKIERERERRTV